MPCMTSSRVGFTRNRPIQGPVQRNLGCFDRKPQGGSAARESVSLHEFSRQLVLVMARWLWLA